MERTERYMQRLKQLVPTLSDSLDQLYRALLHIHSDFTHFPLFPVHGAPHSHQWLDGGSRLGLVDFDRFSFGDREVDVATFLTELEFENIDAAHFNRLKEAFLDAYQSVAGPLHPTLLWAYRTHKCIAKADKAARAVHPNGDVRAAHYLHCAFPVPSFP